MPRTKPRKKRPQPKGSKQPRLTDEAVSLWIEMNELPPCQCKAIKMLTGNECSPCQDWADLHEKLHTELALRPWFYPCVARRTPEAAGAEEPGSMSVPAEEGYALMLALDAAARVRCGQTPPETLIVEAPDDEDDEDFGFSDSEETPGEDGPIADTGPAKT
jgi:hypothetical protein